MKHPREVKRVLTLKIPAKQSWNEKTEEFVYSDAVTLKLEHSLLSLAHWESNWNIPFLSNLDKLTVEQWLDYIRCMTITKGVDPEVYARLTKEQYKAINEYMEAPMTATWFAGESKPNERNSATKPRPKRPPRRGGTVMTAEVLYCQMFSFGIPKECEKWHLNRLLTLIRVCQESQAPAKKMSKGDRLTQQRMLNEQRKAKLKTRG